jgi:hypothetical protein
VYYNLLSEDVQNLEFLTNHQASWFAAVLLCRNIIIGSLDILFITIRRVWFVAIPISLGLFITCVIGRNQTRRSIAIKEYPGIQ